MKLYSKSAMVPKPMLGMVVEFNDCGVTHTAMVSGTSSGYQLSYLDKSYYGCYRGANKIVSWKDMGINEGDIISLWANPQDWKNDK